MAPRRLGDMPGSLAAQGIRLLKLGRRARLSWEYRRQDSSVMRARRSAFYEKAWQTAAADTGAAMTPLDSGVMALEIDGEQLLVAGNTTSLDDPVTLDIAGNKPLVYRLLQHAGVPVPHHIVVPVGDVAGAWRFVSGLGRPCVVKAARDTGKGQGVTAGVSTRRELVSALAEAAVYGGEAIVEEQLAGENFRLLYLDGELLDAICRRPPTVTGDGVHSLKQLIAAENRWRVNGGLAASQTLVPVDRELRLTLKAGGWHLRSVPPAGTVVRLRTVINDNRREDNVSAADRFCPSVIETGAAAARAVGVRLAGIDLITPDPSAPLAACGGAVIEVNTTPGHYHHFTDPSDPARMARMVLGRLAGGDPVPGEQTTGAG